MTSESKKHKADAEKHENEPLFKRRKIENPTLAARLQGINHKFKFNPARNARADRIRELLQEAATEAAEIVAGSEQYDLGRTIHATDLIQQAKDTFVMAMMLPETPAAQAAAEAAKKPALDRTPEEAATVHAAKG
jgi:hypothetical protein